LVISARWLAAVAVPFFVLALVVVAMARHLPSTVVCRPPILPRRSHAREGATTTSDALRARALRSSDKRRDAIATNRRTSRDAESGDAARAQASEGAVAVC
jgi:hypothetical protein